MPRVKLPPTPASSTGPTPKDKLTVTPQEMESAFVLPPAAMKPSPPASPVITRKRTLSGSAKVKDELPPPPSRARKIIQMKPKEETSATTATSPTTPTSGSASTKTNTTPHGKRKQPSATSAAGRRIARKTAHSIIERRRRSKMNEEFGVLKDMIPACKGVEMHKLAILQAGIEYVRYLQGCVEKLQDREEVPSFQMRQGTTTADEDDEDEDMDRADQNDHEGKTPSASPHNKQPEYRRESTATTATTSTHTSPALRPNMSSSSLASQRQLPPLLSKKTYSTSPPPLIVQTPLQTGVSPAFNAIHFSPEISRTYSHTHPSTMGKGSPHILPLPQAAMSMHSTGPASFNVIGSTQGHPGQSGDVHAEATATAALMMMGSDRRGNGSGKGGGMSVRDLLSH